MTFITHHTRAATVRRFMPLHVDIGARPTAEQRDPAVEAAG
ncbi:MAG TPA: hypothetical protein VMH32_17720 [Burkholderiales bacterium]|nr:hypothetical protein [Burkholderiales bacterium]